MPGVGPGFVSGDDNGNDILDLDEVWIYTASGTVQEGLNCNTGMVTGNPVPVGDAVTARDESCYTGVVVPCGVCKGGVTELTLRNNLGVAARIKVVQKNGDTVFEDDVEIGVGETFSFTGKDTDNKFGTEITVFVDDVFHVKIHTSCSRLIGPGLVFGDFEVVEGESKDNGPICPLFGACVEGQVQAAGTLKFAGKRKNKVEWEIANNGPTFLLIESITLTWPTDPNGNLEQIKLDGGFYKQEEDVSPAEINSGFEPEVKRRAIKPGDTKKLVFQFQNEASTDLNLYEIHVEFRGGESGGGCSIEFEAAPPGEVTVCTTKVQSMRLRYVGPDPLDPLPEILGAQVVIDPDKGPDKLFGPLTLRGDGTTELFVPVPDGETEFGAKTGIRILDFSSGNLILEEIIHTSCSTPFVAEKQAPLDGNSPLATKKGDPSPTWFVVSFTQKP